MVLSKFRTFTVVSDIPTTVPSAPASLFRSHHLVAREPDARHKTLDGVLEHQHQHCRSGTQSGNEIQRVTAQNDGHSHNDSDKETDNAEHTAEGVEILLCRRTAAGIHLAHGVNHALQRAERHHGDIYGSEAAHGLLGKGILSEHHRQEPPYHNGGDDVTGGVEHAPREEHIVPLRMGAVSEADYEGHCHMHAQPVGYQGQQGRHNGHHTQCGCLHSTPRGSGGKNPGFYQGFQGFHNIYFYLVRRKGKKEREAQKEGQETALRRYGEIKTFSPHFHYSDRGIWKFLPLCLTFLQEPPPVPLPVSETKYGAWERRMRDFPDNFRGDYAIKH